MSKYTYKFDLSVKGLENMKLTFVEMAKILASKEFKEYFANKMLDEVKQIADKEIARSYDEDFSIYRNHFGKKIESSKIIIYNDAIVSVNQNEKSKFDISKYPNAQISLAKIVEYGIGATGKNTDRSHDNDKSWEYDINNHGEQGWTYYGDDGQLHHTSGFEGKLIFYKLKQSVEKKAKQWITEYLGKQLR